MNNNKVSLCRVVYTYYRRESNGTRFYIEEGTEIAKKIDEMCKRKDKRLTGIYGRGGRGYFIILNERAKIVLADVISEIAGEKVRYADTDEEDPADRAVTLPERLEERGFNVGIRVIRGKIRREFREYVENERDERAKQLRIYTVRRGKQGYKILEAGFPLADKWCDEFLERNGGEDRFTGLRRKRRSEDELFLEGEALPKKTEKGIPFEEIIRMAEVEDEFGKYVIGLLGDFIVRRRSGVLYSSEAADELRKLRKLAVGTNWERLRTAGIVYDRTIDGW